MIPEGTLLVLYVFLISFALIFIFMGMIRKDKPDIPVLFFVCVVGLTACFGVMYIIDNSLPDEYYKAYSLDDQYVGNITTATGEHYNNVLIFDLTLYEYAYGSDELHTRTDMFGNLEIYDSKYLGETEQHVQLYFATENETVNQLHENKPVICRWVETSPGNYYVKRVYGYDEVEWN